MATSGKTYIVEDADNSSDPKGVRTPFPGSLAGLLDALDAARSLCGRSAQDCGHSRGEAATGHQEVRGRCRGVVGVPGGDPQCARQRDAGLTQRGPAGEEDLRSDSPERVSNPDTVIVLAVVQVF
jgi:hypothetical protein